MVELIVRIILIIFALLETVSLICTLNALAYRRWPVFMMEIFGYAGKEVADLFYEEKTSSLRMAALVCVVVILIIIYTLFHIL